MISVDAIILLESHHIVYILIGSLKLIDEDVGVTEHDVKACDESREAGLHRNHNAVRPELDGVHEYCVDLSQALLH